MAKKEVKTVTKAEFARLKGVQRSRITYLCKNGLKTALDLGKEKVVLCDFNEKFFKKAHVNRGKILEKKDEKH